MMTAPALRAGATVRSHRRLVSSRSLSSSLAAQSVSRRIRGYHAGVGRPEGSSAAPGPSPSEGSTPALARDLELIRAWQAGDRAAGATLLDHYRNLVFRACQRCGVRGEDDVLELWQDLVARILSHLPGLEQRVRSSFAGYLIWNVRDLAPRYRRRSSASVPAEPMIDPRATEGVWEAVQHCWEQLPPREHHVFELRFLQGLALGEVADHVGSNANAVAQSIFRLTRRMRACLEGQGFGGGGAS
jgi:RNA polymerase sigma factor (sigma-70 family)